MLVLRLNHPNDPDFSYAQFKRGEPSTTWEPGNWEQHRLMLRKTRHIVVLIPAREVLLTRLTLKANNNRQLRQALPFALEERMIGEPETQHYVWHKTKNSDELNIAVIEQDVLQQWLSALQERGINPEAIYSDVFALPITQPGITIWQIQQGLWIRESALSGYYTPAAMLPALIQQLHEQQQVLLTEAVNDDDIITAPTFTLRVANENLVELPEDSPIELQTEQDPNTLIRNSLQVAQDLNLLNGYRSESSTALAENMKQWRGTAIAAGLVLIIGVAVEVLQTRELMQTRHQIEEQNYSFFQRMFPDAAQPDRAQNLQSLVNIQLNKLQQKSEQKPDNYSPIPLLNTTASALKSQRGLSLTRLEWRQNTLHLNLETTDSQNLSRLEQQLSQALQKNIRIPYSRGAGKVQANVSLNAEQL